MAKQCYGCAFKGSVAGSAHVSCNYKWTKFDHNIPKGDVHGVRNGWFNFPVDFDPVWIDGKCPARSEVVNDESDMSSAFVELVILLRMKQMLIKEK